MIAALMYLPPRQRAAFVLRDVHGWTPQEIAAALDTVVAAVNSLLQRARHTLRRRAPSNPQDWCRPQLTSTDKEILRRYANAKDPETIRTLLAEDVRITMPPEPPVVGIDAAAEFLGRAPDWRTLPTSANGRPTLINYLRRPGSPHYEALVVDVLRIENGKIVESKCLHRCPSRCRLQHARHARFVDEQGSSSVTEERTRLNQPGGHMIKVLFENPWLSLRTVYAPDRGIDGYVFSHEDRCQGRIVAVLPYHDTPAGRRYLVRSEVTPCWSLDPQLSALTGGYEGGDIEDDAVREVLEEAGYAITRADLVPLGDSYASKSADTVYSLFAVNVTGRAQSVATGDGSALEARGSTRWLDTAEVCKVRDPQVAVMVMRLEHQRP
ncbi:sigma factor-like helix-turn-helix DNA-binding protein [Micromonospora sp. WMMD1120]|uniref:sigma factor-like helix-turn-helix DNA-binding protein n=1 Tax=Micromonospora sp. WMMD1120 TaxID=3016106 RepID=UPI0024162BD4|nr:sigma factor-like helix-turn-helix DNA-binding protein [Micromonospora sp. WMMD1120]MDG4809328.1 sigma factor-like helix-turn-helix DNA-binding protein [Micromonospora sp. WMMD1120]